MHQDSYHTPVLLDAVVDLFSEVPPGVIVDATFGGGGHARALAAMRDDIRVVGIDRDADVPELDVEVVRGSFGDLDSILQAAGIPALVGALFDLGVSSHQFDTPNRGFSYGQAGPLDMRMDSDASLSADEIVNDWDEVELSRVISRYGEERFARRIARAIVSSRPVSDTVELAEVIRSAIPAATRRRGGHPARRTFQALRIAVNQELDELETGLDAALEVLEQGGRCVVISYHSLEDRIVKRRFARGAESCTCPPDLPVCRCDTVQELRILTRKPLRPSEDEVAANPRARSAILRAVEKVAA